MDPRPLVVDRRLAGIGRILAVTGGKGGIGKSSVACGIALSLVARGERVGLLDLDFCGPSAHVILGARATAPREDHGIVPTVVHGIAFLSIASFVGDEPLPLRGEDVSNILLELLAITRWGTLDTLVVDMPPGFTDPQLDAARLLRRAAYVVVATPSVVARETVVKTLRLLRELGLPVAGIVGNMWRGGTDPSSGLGLGLGPERPVLGVIGYDPAYEGAVGDPTSLAGTVFMRDIQRAVDALQTADRVPSTLLSGPA